MNAPQQTLLSPVLEDAALLPIRTKLTTNLSWLTSAYGRAEKRLVRSGNVGEAYYPAGREIYYPAIHVNTNSGEDYLNMFPDSNLGNFSFFDLRDEQRILNFATKSPQKNIYQFGAGLVVWFDFRTVYPSPLDWRQYSTANVIQLVINQLQTMQVPGVGIEIERYYEDVQNIYRGYSHNEIQSQFAMRPFGCFRIELNLTYKKLC